MHPESAQEGDHIEWCILIRSESLLELFRTLTLPLLGKHYYRNAAANGRAYLLGLWGQGPRQ